MPGKQTGEGVFELLIRGSFTATHAVRLPDGRMEPPHPHDWRVEIHLESDRLDQHGMVADFAELQSRLGAILRDYQNMRLSDIPDFSGTHPTTEIIARQICRRYQPGLPAGVGVVRVRVWETPECAAAYVPARGDVA